MVRRQDEIRRRLVAVLKRRKMANDSEDTVERDLLIGIEQMVNAQRGLAAMAHERFVGLIPAPANLLITIREAAARHAHSYISMGAECAAHTQLRIQISRSDGQAQREVGREKVWLVMIKVGVERERRVPLERGIITELKQVALNGINLGKSARTAQKHCRHRS